LGLVPAARAFGKSLKRLSRPICFEKNAHSDPEYSFL
jgi:hypothetical protein